jgi:CobQ-like glutamine amidotransferase family enzyme
MNTQNVKYTITIGWLYPKLMSTYGDRGNILYFQRRAALRGIHTTVVAIDADLSAEKIADIDFIFGGGSQDIEQEIVTRDLLGKKAEALKARIERNIPALFVCGSPQLMGNTYEPGMGKKIAGLGIFDMESVHPGLKVPRCIGNTVGDVIAENIHADLSDKRIIGFENHGGRSYLGKNVKPFAQVVKGYGNNGSDGSEGMVYKNAVGCYYHGPFLPKNPAIADFFIARCVEVKYGERLTLEPRPDMNEKKAREVLLKRWGL